LNGIVQFSFITSTRVVDLIETGQLRAIAATGTIRADALSTVPTVIELGYPNLAGPDWNGLVARRGTPGEVLSQLNSAINEVLRRESVRVALRKIGAAPTGGTAAEFDGLLRSDIEKWGKIIKDAGIRLPR